LLREPVIVGEVVRVTHVGTGEQLDCTVKDIDPGERGRPEIGIEFAHPNPRFWRVSFPPVGWTPHSPGQGLRQAGCADGETPGGQEVTALAAPRFPAIFAVAIQPAN